MSFASSLGSNLTFSNKIAFPGSNSFANFFALSPTISVANLTSKPKYSDNLSATGLNVRFGLISPLGLPKCEHKITFALCSNKYFIVGNAATILKSFVIFPVSLSSGTLKSHLTNTFLF